MRQSDGLRVLQGFTLVLHDYLFLTTQSTRFIPPIRRPSPSESIEKDFAQNTSPNQSISENVVPISKNVHVNVNINTNTNTILHPDKADSNLLGVTGLVENILNHQEASVLAPTSLSTPTPTTQTSTPNSTPISEIKNKLTSDLSPSVSMEKQQQPQVKVIIEENSNNGKQKLRERAVPSSAVSRFLGFGSLAVGIAAGTIAEEMRRAFTKNDQQVSWSAAASDANAERLAQTLCKMRGAALKLGQMLSIQDEGVLPQPLVNALERVRSAADVMPKKQLMKQLNKELGDDWREKLKDFNESPLAAASIGQVHRGILHDGRAFAMKIQYPGVAESIESDLNNLKRLVTLTNLLPPGLFIDEIVAVAREELTRECNYYLEAENQRRFQTLVHSDTSLQDHVIIPDIIDNLSTRQVLTSTFIEGVPIDKLVSLPQEERNFIARLILKITFKELFEWRYMQTDPNWGNFLYDYKSKKLGLIDFGASREFDKRFIDKYIQLVWASAQCDEKKLIEMSTQLGFLTGDESLATVRAHVDAGFVVGEPFTKHEPFDFRNKNITLRIFQLGDTVVQSRLSPPPREAYSLHRKLGGAFLLCIKLGAIISCRDLLEDVYYSYQFD